MTILLIVAGLILLILGAELLVRGASRLAMGYGISPLVVGITVVAFGTSAPELAIGVNSVLSGQEGISLGNIIGSNIFNVLFILGISAMVGPLIISAQLIRLDVPIMILLSVLVLLFGLDGFISLLDGLIFILGAVAYTWFLIRHSRKEKREVHDQFENNLGRKRSFGTLQNILLIIFGLGLLVVGSRWLVSGAVTLAEALNVSEMIIGLTIIAAGTSLPEVVTSLVASIRGARDIAVGNIVGSSIFNIVFVLGISSVVAPNGIAVSDAVIGFDIPVMITLSFACLPIFFTGGKISRWEGGVLFFYYVAYTLYLILDTSHHDSLPRFSGFMLYFAIPLTLVTLGVLAFQEWQRKKS